VAEGSDWRKSYFLPTRADLAITKMRQWLVRCGRLLLSRLRVVWLLQGRAGGCRIMHMMCLCWLEMSWPPASADGCCARHRRARRKSLLAAASPSPSTCR
jgi:hypothetical protein